MGPAVTSVPIVLAEAVPAVTTVTVAATLRSAELAQRQGGSRIRYTLSSRTPGSYVGTCYGKLVV
jgi:hypothetical protein